MTEKEDAFRGLPFVTHLQATIERALYRDALARMCAVRRDGRDERIQLVPLLLQLLHQRLDRALGEAFALASLPVAHQRVDDAQAGVRTGRGGRWHCCHVADD